MSNLMDEMVNEIETVAKHQKISGKDYDPISDRRIKKKTATATSKAEPEEVLVSAEDFEKISEIKDKLRSTVAMFPAVVDQYPDLKRRYTKMEELDLFEIETLYAEIYHECQKLAAGNQAGGVLSGMYFVGVQTGEALLLTAGYNCVGAGVKLQSNPQVINCLKLMEIKYGSVFNMSPEYALIMATGLAFTGAYAENKARIECQGAQQTQMSPEMQALLARKMAQSGQQNQANTNNNAIPFSSTTNPGGPQMKNEFGQGNV